jgi:hypothetical protein
MDRTEVHRMIERSGCRVIRPARGGFPAEFDCGDNPWAKVRMLNALAIADARYDRNVRRIAEKIAQRAPSTEPFALASWIQSCVQRRVRYVGEGIETFQSASKTWRLGLGDCDDSARLVAALALALGLDAEVQGMPGRDGNPVHAVARIEGRFAEASLAARYGEHPVKALRRLQADGKDTRIYRRSGMSGSDLNGPDDPNASARQAARAALSDAWDRIPGMPAKTDSALQMVQAIALGPEGSDGGSCWSRCPGVCHNWGGVQLPGSPVTHDGTEPSCPDGSAPCVDTTPQSDGSSKSYGVCFKTYPSQADGAVDYLRTLILRSNDTQTAVGSGSALKMADAMYDSHYFQGFGATREERVATYAKAIMSGARRISGSLGEPLYLSEDGGGGVSSDDAGMLLFGAMCLGAAALVRRHLKKKKA